MLLTWFLLRGAEDSALVNKLLAVVNVCLLCFFTTTGILYSDSENWVGVLSDKSVSTSEMVSGVLAATGTVFYSFVGFD